MANRTHSKTRQAGDRIRELQKDLIATETIAAERASEIASLNACLNVLEAQRKETEGRIAELEERMRQLETAASTVVLVPAVAPEQPPDIGPPITYVGNTGDLDRQP